MTGSRDERAIDGTSRGRSIAALVPPGGTSITEGVVLVDKPKGMTSFEVVRSVRRAAARAKVGHAGTLDPMATGLLVTLVGGATKASARFQDMDKEYTGTIRLGQTTPSYDADTPVNETRDTDGLTKEMVEEAAKLFIGTTTQLTPAYSAVRVDGERMYKKARRGQRVRRPPRVVTVTHFEITGFADSDADFCVRCSKGTYVRALANDIGAALGVGGHLTALRRTRIGDLRVDDAWKMSDIDSLGIRS